MQHIQVDIGTAKLACQIRGEGKYTLIIESAIHACSAEWWPIADQLAKYCMVITYDRASYGMSSRSSLPRTTDCIVKELSALIECLKIETPIVFLAHSQGAFFAQQYSRLYPDNIKGLVLIDPITHAFPQLRYALKPDLYKKSGIDRSNSLSIPVFLGRLGLLSFFKGMLIKLPPLVYYEFNEDEINYITKHKLRLSSCLAALKEQKCFYDCIPFIEDTELKPFPAVPLKILYHSPAFMINEIMHYGPLSKHEATKIEQLWFDMTSKAIDLSPYSTFAVARFSGNFMYLSEQKFIIDAVKSLLNN